MSTDCNTDVTAKPVGVVKTDAQSVVLTEDDSSGGSFDSKCAARFQAASANCCAARAEQYDFVLASDFAKSDADGGPPAGMQYASKEARLYATVPSNKKEEAPGVAARVDKKVDPPPAITTLSLLLLSFIVLLVVVVR